MQLLNSFYFLNAQKTFICKYKSGNAGQIQKGCKDLNSLKVEQITTLSAHEKKEFWKITKVKNKLKIVSSCLCYPFAYFEVDNKGHIQFWIEFSIEKHTVISSTKEQVFNNLKQFEKLKVLLSKLNINSSENGDYFIDVDFPE